MANDGQLEAGVFVLTAEGWIIAKRRAFADQPAALQWMKRHAAAQARKNPSQRIRGSILQTTDWVTLDSVLAEYEQKRRALHHDFIDPE